MASCKYKLRYIPLFYEDFNEILTYIRDKLQNPDAASNLIDLVEAAILERLTSPESFEKFNSVRERKYPYYKIRVKNYTVFYVVIEITPNEKIMEVRRILYSKRDWSKFFKNL